VQDEQGEETFNDLVLKKCPYYFSLLDIVADRASTQPRITNYRPADLDTDEESSKNDDDTGGVDVLSAMGADDDDDDYDAVTSATATGTPSPPAVAVGVPNTTVATSRSSARGSEASVASSRKSSRKKPRRGSFSNPLMDEDTVHMLSAAIESSKKKMDELKRHHQQLEMIEKEKIDLEKKKYEDLKWKGRSEKLDYKMKLVSDYQKLKEQGMTDDRIDRLFPEMKGVIEVFNGGHPSGDQR
jgi:hypothetical protein